MYTPRLQPTATTAAAHKRRRVEDEELVAERYEKYAGPRAERLGPRYARPPTAYMNLPSMESPPPEEEAVAKHYHLPPDRSRKSKNQKKLNFEN